MNHFQLTPLSMKGQIYVLQERIGSEQYASVYKGWNLEDFGRHPVAIKLYHPKVSLEKVANEFYHLSKALRSDHLVQGLDYGVSAPPFIVMEYVPETVLARTNKDEDGGLQALVLDYLCQIPEILTELRDKDIIHSDLKASNLGWQDRLIKVLDFGEAVSYEQEIPFSAKFVPVYNAPEMRRKENPIITPASDIYSAGKVFEKMLLEKYEESPEAALQAMEEHYHLVLPWSFHRVFSAMTAEDHRQRPNPEDVRPMAREAARDLSQENYFSRGRIHLGLYGDIDFFGG